MKSKLIALLLTAALLMTLVACGKDASGSGDDVSGKSKASEWNPDVPDREVLSDEGSMCGVYYVNYDYDAFSGMKKNRKYYNRIFKSADLLKRFSFMKKIPDEYIISTSMGTEIYLIIPADPEAHVDVYELSMEEDSFTPVRKGTPIYSNQRGVPFVLQCNYGDLFSDAEIVITDSDGQELKWSPFISLKDGTVNNQTDDGKTVYDFTEYPQSNEVMDD